MPYAWPFLGKNNNVGKVMFHLHLNTCYEIIHILFLVLLKINNIHTVREIITS